MNKLIIPYFVYNFPILKKETYPSKFSECFSLVPLKVKL